MVYLKNPHRGDGLPVGPLPLARSEMVAQLLSRCPRHAATPLRDLPELAARHGIARLHLKDESARMGLGSFKALGAAFVIARAAQAASDGAAIDGRTLQGHTYVAASAGNHGLSVAAGARLFGARAVIFLAETVPEGFADRLRAMGAEVQRAGATYEASMQAAQDHAAAQGWTLLSDSSWEGYIELPTAVMEGYLQLAMECAQQIAQPPTHILLQAGVGGLAAAAARHFRAVWGDAPQIVVVEPDRAPALHDSIRAGWLVTADGPVSSMGRLDCKTPSLVALAGLSQDADAFVTITDAEAAAGVAELAAQGLPTTPSGAAGYAALACGLPGLGAEARVLAILSEGPEDG